MKKFVVAGALLLSMVLTLGFASNADALGRPIAVLITSSQGSVVALIDLDQTQFTELDALQAQGFMTLAVPIVKQALGAQFQTAQALIFGPDQMASFGLGDADTANTFILNNIAALKVTLYIRAVFTKVAPPQGSGATEQNVRGNFYLYSGAGTTIGYVGSVEVPLNIASLLGGFLTF